MAAAETAPPLFVMGNTVVPVSIIPKGSDAPEITPALQNHVLKLVKAVHERNFPAGEEPITTTTTSCVVHGSFLGVPFTFNLSAKPWPLVDRYQFSNEEEGRQFDASPVKWSVEVAAIDN